MYCMNGLFCLHPEDSFEAQGVTQLLAVAHCNRQGGCPHRGNLWGKPASHKLALLIFAQGCLECAWAAAGLPPANTQPPEQLSAGRKAMIHKVDS